MATRNRQPAATKPGPPKPAATKPKATQPTATKPAATKPTATTPVATQPAATKPAAPPPPPNVRRRAALLGRSFAGTIATRLDAHAPTPEGDRVADERRILKLIQDVLAQVDPDPCAVNFITQAVEMHTTAYGASKVIYDRLFELHEERLERRAMRPPARRAAPHAERSVAAAPARPERPKIPAFKAPPPPLKA